jgi:putative addiction module killer protein
MSLIRYINNLGGDRFEIAIFQTRSGRAPFEEWFLQIKDEKTKAMVRTRLARLRLGNFGDRKALGEGVWELRIDFGPGFRIYYAMSGKTVVLLLSAGDKSSQSKDIKKAKSYWLELRREKDAKEET